MQGLDARLVRSDGCDYTLSAVVAGVALFLLPFFFQPRFEFTSDFAQVAAWLAVPAIGSGLVVRKNGRMLIWNPMEFLKRFNYLLVIVGSSAGGLVAATATSLMA
jgi:hypothetical protein